MHTTLALHAISFGTHSYSSSSHLATQSRWYGYNLKRLFTTLSEVVSLIDLLFSVIR